MTLLIFNMLTGYNSHHFTVRLILHGNYRKALIIMSIMSECIPKTTVSEKRNLPWLNQFDLKSRKEILLIKEERDLEIFKDKGN